MNTLNFLQEKFLRNRGVPNLSSVADIHVICGCLKEFLRSLREPLVTYGLWWKFVAAVKTRDSDMRKAKLYQVVSDLPKPNKDTLAYVIQHLQRYIYMFIRIHIINNILLFVHTSSAVICQLSSAC